MAVLTSTYEAERDYIDNFSVKELMSDEIIPEYFPDIDPSLRSVGTLGYLTELVTNYGEDGFNTASLLFREAFPNRAELTESIYSHAAIFQLSDIFATPSECTFLVVLEEAAIIKNMTITDENRSRYSFTISKDTTIYVEDIPYVLDYNVVFDIIRRKNATSGITDYLFTVKYDLDEYENSISTIYNPYIKLRRSTDGYIAIEVLAHQCYREIRFENIISNSNINYPIIDLTFYGQLAGLDVLYKSPDATEYIQLETRLRHSLPTTDPFCYYEMKDTGTIRITFNTRDNYFMPDFNSQLKVILYITNGASGNFNVYNGTNITMAYDQNEYVYTYPFLTAAKPISASINGVSRLDLEALRNLTVEGFRTAMALTSENDLQQYFLNYPYRYGNGNVLFLKKRNDVYERVYAAYLLMRNENYIFHTNTLSLDINLGEFESIDNGNAYLLEPGHLFTIPDDSGFAEFYRDDSTYKLAYRDYLDAIENGETYYIPGDQNLVHEVYLKNRPCSFAEYCRRHGIDTKVSIFDMTKLQVKQLGLDDFKKKKFLLFNPFLLRLNKNPNVLTTYMTYVRNNCLLDFVGINNESYVQWISYNLQVDRKLEKEKRYHIHVELTPNIFVNDNIYPPLVAEYEADGVTFLRYKYLGDKYKVHLNDLRVIGAIKDDSGDYCCFFELTPTEFDNDTRRYIFETDIHTDDHISSTGDLRILKEEIYRFESDMYIDSKLYLEGSYFMVEDPNRSEMYTYFDKDGNVLATDIDVGIVRHYYLMSFVSKHSNVWSMTEADDIIVPLHDAEVGIFTLYKRNVKAEGDNTEGDVGTLVVNSDEQTNNIFTNAGEKELEKRRTMITNLHESEEITEAEYMDYFNALEDTQHAAYTWAQYYTYHRYIWTNEYLTGQEPVDFMKRLSSVRTYLTYKDYTAARVDEESGEVQFAYDVMDIMVRNIPMVRETLFYDEDMLDYFMNSFTAQYQAITSIVDTDLRNETEFDVKFYNTYGPSRNFTIGEDTNTLQATNFNTVNMEIEFDIWYIDGVDTPSSSAEIKEFIRDDIISINDDGMNFLYISNLMRKVENQFSYVDHMRFKRINDFSADYQAVKTKFTSVDDLSVEERRFFVPELLVINTDDVILNEYTVSYD